MSAVAVTCAGADVNFSPCRLAKRMLQKKNVENICESSATSQSIPDWRDTREKRETSKKGKCCFYGLLKRRNARLPSAFAHKMNRRFFGLHWPRTEACWIIISHLGKRSTNKSMRVGEAYKSREAAFACLKERRLTSNASSYGAAPIMTRLS